MTLIKEDVLNGRKLELYQQDSLPEWDYEKPQTDTFAIYYPKDYDPENIYPLWVVFHSAGHDVYSTIECIKQEGNHDIYHVVDDAFGLILDCRANTQGTTDWWWGGASAQADLSDPEAIKKRGIETQPVEKRCIATVLDMMAKYPIDENRVYACGNSMGGSGSLGIALSRGDIFAGIKANVPAGVRHAADRCCLDLEAPEGFKIPDPPIVVDYSAQNDGWSDGHEVLYDGMNAKKYLLMGFWGAFGHANNHAQIAKYNDLIHSFDLFGVKKNEAYPAFTNASTNDPLPWPSDRDSKAAGQVNAFFRWEVIKDEENEFEIMLRLINESDWQTRVELPKESTADVTMRRLQNFKANDGDEIAWEYGETKGNVTCKDGIFTVEKLAITQDGCILKFNK